MCVRMLLPVIGLRQTLMLKEGRLHHAKRLQRLDLCHVVFQAKRSSGGRL